jgi:hypothetical protein
MHNEQRGSIIVLVEEGSSQCMAPGVGCLNVGGAHFYEQVIEGSGVPWKLQSLRGCDICLRYHEHASHIKMPWRCGDA